MPELLLVLSFSWERLAALQVMVFTTLEKLRSGQYIFGRLSSEFSDSGKEIVIKERDNDIGAAAQAAADGNYEATDTVLLFCRSGRNPYLFCGRITPDTCGADGGGGGNNGDDDPGAADGVEGTVWCVGLCPASCPDV